MEFQIYLDKHLFLLAGVVRSDVYYDVLKRGHQNLHVQLVGLLDNICGLKMALVKCFDSLTPSDFTQVKEFCLQTQTRRADLSTL